MKFCESFGEGEGGRMIKGDEKKWKRESLF